MALLTSLLMINFNLINLETPLVRKQTRGNATSPIYESDSLPFLRFCLFLLFGAQQVTADLNTGCFAANGRQLRREIGLAERLSKV